MGGIGFRERIRRNVLAGRGLERVGKGHIEGVPQPPHDSRKTRLMELLEDKHGLPMEDMLMAGTLEEVGAQLGVDQSTVSKWRERLGLR